MRAQLQPGRVGFLTDFYRGPMNGVASTGPARNAIFQLFSPTLARLGWACEFIAPIEEGGAVNTPAVMEAFGIVPGIAGWAAAVSATLLPEHDSLLGNLCEQDLVIAYGAAPAVLRYLDLRGIPFLDLEVAPVRFAHDLFFRARTNHPSIARSLKHIAAQEDYFYEEAARLRATLSWQGFNFVEKPASNYGVFAGQFAVDLALVAGGVLPDLHHYAERLRDYFSDVDGVIFAPHPYDANPALHRALGEICGPVLDSKVGTYRLLASLNVKKIAAFSSSVLKEAGYFGKTTTALIKPDAAMDFPEFNVGPDISSRAFWASCLEWAPFAVSPPHPRPLSRLVGMRWGLDDGL